MKKQYRTVWISDTHLGTKGCQVEKLHNFLTNTESENLFLVGDIIDFWALKRKSYWPQSHNTILQKILKKARHGTKVIYMIGNHDEVLIDYIGMSFGDITLEREYNYKLKDGRNMLILHGDIFDMVTKYHKWIAVLGDIGYECLLWLNRIYNVARIKLGFSYWSLSQFIKSKVKEAVSFIGDYENAVVNKAAELNVDVVLCGHIHHAEMKKMGDVLYINTGDFVESCTAVVEHLDGTLEIIRW